MRGQIIDADPATGAHLLVYDEIFAEILIGQVVPHCAFKLRRSHQEPPPSPRPAPILVFLLFLVCSQTGRFGRTSCRSPLPPLLCLCSVYRKLRLRFCCNFCLHAKLCLVAASRAFSEVAACHPREVVLNPGIYGSCIRSRAMLGVHVDGLRLGERINQAALL
jgi:hypothetical protein